MFNFRKVLLTLGNVLILLGVCLLLAVGALLANEQYQVYAAGGTVPDPAGPRQAAVREQVLATPELSPPPTASTPAAVASQLTTATTVPPPDVPPLAANGSEGQLTNVASVKRANFGPSTVSRIEIPAIKVDRKVVEVGWTVQQDGQAVAIWDVDKYRVGHHGGTSNPGGGGNIVLSGHSGGWQYPFNDIFYLKPGDLIQLTSSDQVYDYTVLDHILVDEIGQPLEKRLENARYIEPTDEDIVTMVACWPLTGPDKLKQRIIIRAKPVPASVDTSRNP